MVVNMKVSGKKTTCMAKASTPGKMVEATRASTKTTEKTDLEYTHGMMVNSMKVNGRTVNSMEKVSTVRRV